MISLVQELHSELPSRENTATIQRAIDEAARRGGDTIQIPAGRWIIQTIYLKSGVILDLAAGATLEADTDLSQYPMEHGDGENADMGVYHLIHAEGAEHTGITGEGTIDGRGPEFWHPPLKEGGFYRHWSNEDGIQQRISPLLEFRNCRYLTLRGITIRNSPGWTVHPFCCEHLTFDGVTIENDLFGPNTDGFDINGCRYVFISNCRLHCGDDAIIIKASREARASEHIVVTNCIIETNCGALALGAETHFDIRNVVFSNCTIINSHRMLAIIMWQQGTVENVSFNNITGTCQTSYGIDRPIHIDIQEHVKEDPKLGHMRNIQFSNIQCRSKGRLIMTAQDGAHIENVTVRDFHLDIPDLEDPTEACRTPGSSQMSNGSPEARIQKAAVIADNVHRLTLENVSVKWPDSPTEVIPFHGLWTRKVQDLRLNSPRLTANQAGIADHEVSAGS